MGYLTRSMMPVMAQAMKMLNSRMHSETSDSLTPKPWLLSLFGGPASDTGIEVTPESARRVTTVYTCVNRISNAIACMPINLFVRNKDGGKDVDRDHVMYDKVHWQPNRWMNIFEFLHMMTSHLLLRGNAYAYLSAATGEIIPLHPDRITIEIKNDGSWIYHYVTAGGIVDKFIKSEILHLKGMTDDGVYGLSPIRECMNAVGLSIATEKHGSRLFANAARPQGYFKHPSTLSKEAQESLKQSWQKNYAGAENSHGVGVLEEGVEWVKLGLDPEEAQFLETRKYQRTEIAAIYNVPPWMVGDLERAIHSNMEQQGQDFVTNCLLPWMTIWEKGLTCSIFSEKERKKRYFKLNSDVFLRADSAQRSNYYMTGRQWGFLSINDIRDKEDMNKLPPAQGDVYEVPLNMVPAGTDRTQIAQPVDNKNKQDEQADKEKEPIQKPDDNKKKVKRAIMGLLEREITRALTKESLALESAQKKPADKRAEWSKDFYPKLKEDLRSNTQPVLDALETVGVSVSDEAVTLWAVEYCQVRITSTAPIADVSLEASNLAAKLLSKAS